MLVALSCHFCPFCFATEALIRLLAAGLLELLLTKCTFGFSPPHFYFLTEYFDEIYSRGTLFLPHLTVKNGEICPVVSEKFSSSEGIVFYAAPCSSDFVR